MFIKDLSFIHSLIPNTALTLVSFATSKRLTFKWPLFVKGLLKNKKYVWFFLNWKWVWPCCFGICPLFAGRKVHNMSHSVSRKEKNLSTECPQKGDQDSWWQALKYWLYGWEFLTSSYYNNSSVLTWSLQNCLSSKKKKLFYIIHIAKLSSSWQFHLKFRWVGLNFR